MNSLEDTICAVSTPPGLGGIGIVRVSGPRAAEILGRLFRRRPEAPPEKRRPPSRRVRYGFLVSGDGRVLDEVLATYLAGPRTYTRQDMVEIGCHGGYASLVAVVGELVRAGCRLAGPGEFTRRAFAFGRIDLARAQATLAVISSRTEEERLAALNQLRGGVSRLLERASALLGELLARLDAGIDFPGDVPAGDADPAGTAREIEAIGRLLSELAAGSRQGDLFSRGLAAAIVGRPNVGKSSLLNALLSAERAIVSEVPGTTRDEVSETLSVAGYPVTLVDTAGIRPARPGSVEAAGVSRARARLAGADLVLLVLDRSRPLSAADRRLLAAADPARAVLVLNKADLPDRLGVPAAAGAFAKTPVSALTGEGLERLREVLGEMVASGRAFSRAGEPVFLALRQKELLAGAHAAVEEAAAAAREGLPAEIVASALGRASRQLAVMTGRDAAEDVLDSLFAAFCIGK